MVFHDLFLNKVLSFVCLLSHVIPADFKIKTSRSLTGNKSYYDGHGHCLFALLMMTESVHPVWNHLNELAGSAHTTQFIIVLISFSGNQQGLRIALCILYWCKYNQFLLMEILYIYVRQYPFRKRSLNVSHSTCQLFCTAWLGLHSFRHPSFVNGEFSRCKRANHYNHD